MWRIVVLFWFALVHLTATSQDLVKVEDTGVQCHGVGVFSVPVKKMRDNVILTTQDNAYKILLRPYPSIPIELGREKYGGDGWMLHQYKSLTSMIKKQIEETDAGAIRLQGYEIVEGLEERDPTQIVWAEKVTLIHNPDELVVSNVSASGKFNARRFKYDKHYRRRGEGQPFTHLVFLQEVTIQDERGDHPLGRFIIEMLPDKDGGINFYRVETAIVPAAIAVR